MFDNVPKLLTSSHYLNFSKIIKDILFDRAELGIVTAERPIPALRLITTVENELASTTNIVKSKNDISIFNGAEIVKILQGDIFKIINKYSLSPTWEIILDRLNFNDSATESHARYFIEYINATTQLELQSKLNYILPGKVNSLVDDNLYIFNYAIPKENKTFYKFTDRNLINKIPESANKDVAKKYIFQNWNSTLNITDIFSVNKFDIIPALVNAIQLQTDFEKFKATYYNNSTPFEVSNATQTLFQRGFLIRFAPEELNFVNIEQPFKSLSLHYTSSGQHFQFGSRNFYTNRNLSRKQTRGYYSNRNASSAETKEYYLENITPFIVDINEYFNSLNYPKSAEYISYFITMLFNKAIVHTTFNRTPVGQSIAIHILNYINEFIVEQVEYIKHKTKFDKFNKLNDFYNANLTAYQDIISLVTNRDFTIKLLDDLSSLQPLAMDYKHYSSISTTYFQQLLIINDRLALPIDYTSYTYAQEIYPLLGLVNSTAEQLKQSISDYSKFNWNRDKPQYYYGTNITTPEFDQGELWDNDIETVYGAFETEFDAIKAAQNYHSFRPYLIQENIAESLFSVNRSPGGSGGSGSKYSGLTLSIGGGGGAGGYLGKGGNGQTVSTDAIAGQGGGAAGGSYGDIINTVGLGGGGVSVLGLGKNGVTAGSGGSQTVGIILGGTSATDIHGGIYGGGGAGGIIDMAKLAGRGGRGAVRIIWGKNRSYPANAKEILGDLAMYLDAGSYESYLSGNVWNDVSGNNATAIINRSTVATTQTNGLRYISFTNDFNQKIDFSIPNLTSSQITVEMWARVSDFNGGMLFGWFAHDMWTDGGALGFSTGRGDLFGISPARVQALNLKGQWVQYVFVMNAGNYTINKIYINAHSEQLSQQRTPQQASQYTNFNNGNGRIGGWLVNDLYPQVMDLAIWKVYNRGLTDSEITYAYYENRDRFNENSNISEIAIQTGSQAMFDLPGSYIFEVPDGITSISAVAVGGGGGGGNYGAGGGGGELVYKNFIEVTPKERLTVIVGSGGIVGSIGQSGSMSGIFKNIQTVLQAEGGHGGGFGSNRENGGNGGGKPEVIGTITVQSSNYNQTVNLADSFIICNSEKIRYTVSRGHTVAVIDPKTLDVKSINVYDTYALGAGPLRSALLDIPNGMIVAISSFDATTFDQATRNYVNSAFKTTETSTWGPSKVSHIIIGVKGGSLDPYESISTSATINSGLYSIPSTLASVSLWSYRVLIDTNLVCPLPRGRYPISWLLRGG